MAILKLSVEALKDTVVLHSRMSGENLWNVVAVGLVPVELRDVPEVGKAILGLGPQLSKRVVLAVVFGTAV